MAKANEIKAKGDLNYIKECIDNKSLGLSEDDIIELIIATRDIDYINDCIKHKEIDIYRIDELRAALVDLIVEKEDPIFIKACLENSELDIGEMQAIRLILELNDLEYIKYCVKLPKFSEIPQFQLILIKGSGNNDYIKECVDNPDLNLDIDDRVDLITSTYDVSYMKACLNDSKYNWYNYDRITLLEAINEPSYIKKYLNSPDYSWDSYEKIELLNAIGDLDYMKSYLIDEGNKWDESEHDYLKKQMLRLIKKNADIKFVSDNLDAKGFIKDEDEKIKFILATEKIDFFKACIESKEDILSEKGKDILTAFSKDDELIENRFDSMGEEVINLPLNMTAGMESESEGKLSQEILHQFEYKKWEKEVEVSLECGVEVKSPKLTSNIEDTKELYTVINALNKMGQTVSERCGGHVHIGADYLQSKEAYANLMELYCNTEKALYAISNEKGTIPRTGIMEQAVVIADSVYEAIEEGTVDLNDEAELDEFIESLKEIQKTSKIKGYEDRSVGLNLLNVNNAKNTIEFRLPNGTLNPELWIENINLFGGMIAVAQELAEIEKKEIKTKEDEEKLKLFNEVKYDENEKESLKSLLLLIGVKLEKYIDRYETNIELMDEISELKEYFGEKKVIDFRKSNKKIAVKNVGETIQNVTAKMQKEAADNIVQSYKREKGNVLEK